MRETEWFERFLVNSNHDNADIIFVLEEGLRRVKLGWCQTQNALDKFGKMTWPDSDEATCWCAAGAVLATNPSSFGGGVKYTERLWGDCFTILAIPLPKPQDVHSSEWTPQGQVTGWNDGEGRTIDDVVELYETALIFARNPPIRPAAPAQPFPTPGVPTQSEWMVRWVEAMRAAQGGDSTTWEELGIPFFF